MCIGKNMMLVDIWELYELVVNVENMKLLSVKWEG